MPADGSAGPTIHSAAKPDFSDPLSNARPQTPGTAADNTAGDNTGSNSGIVELESELGILGNRANGDLQEEQTDDIAETVRDEFLGQGPRQVTGRDDSASLDSIVDQQDGSSSGVIRALINSVPGETSGDQGGQNRSAGGASSTASILDDTLTNLVATILNPTLSAEGLVTFSIVGFGDFALLLLQESGGIFLVDMESGSAVTFAEGSNRRANRLNSTNTNASGQPDRPPSNAFQKVVEFLEKTVLPIVTSPITLASIALFGLIWVVLRLSARG